MRIRGLVIAAAVFLILAGILYWSNRQKPESQPAKVSADAPPTILKLDQNSIEKLELKNKDSEPIVLSKNDGNWQISKPEPLRADQSAVSGVLSAVSSLNADRLVEDKTSDLKRYGLDQPAAETILTEKDNKTQHLLFGDSTPTGSAVYAALAGDARVFTVSTYTKNNVDKSLNDLRDKRLLTVNEDKITKVELVKTNQSIEFGRDKDEWQIIKPRLLRADNTQVDDLVRKLTDARMELDSTDSSDKKSNPTSRFAAGKPVATAKVTDQSGTEELQVRKNKDDYYAKSSIVPGAYKVSSDLGRGLNKSLDDFRNKKLFDFGFNDPNKIELHDGTKAYFLTRSGEDWWDANGKKIDPDATQTLVSDIRDLSASKFLDSGFGKPDIEVIVTSNDSKRNEKVSLCKSGDHYVGKRENDSSLYEIQTSSVEGFLKAADGLKPAATSNK